MKLAIHHRPGSYSNRWINYCKSHSVDYKIVNAFDSNIMEQLKDCDAFLWHYHHGIYEDVLVARKILFALEHAGVMVYPNFKTAWHFDDKVAQKYLLEAINAPMVPSYVFYDKKKALEWVDQTDFPKVFKLTGGAGSSNVRLVKTKNAARSVIKKAFGRGFSQFAKVGYLLDILKKYKANKATFKNVVGGFYHLVIPPRFARLLPREKGYVYFQEFVPNNEFDIRVIIVDNKAFALKRLTRKGDFRASGSGAIIYDIGQIDKRCVETAFNVNQSLQSQSVAFDFVFESDNRPLIVEISFGFSVLPYDKCEGFWDPQLDFHKESFNPQEWMIDSILKE